MVFVKPQKEFSTRAVLAAIHAFPGIMAAGTSKGITEAFDELRRITPQIAGVSFETDHIGWCNLGSALQPFLKNYFSELSAEPIPDSEFWSGPSKEKLEEKLVALGEWIARIENRYGATVKVPDFSQQVQTALAAREFDPLIDPENFITLRIG